MNETSALKHLFKSKTETPVSFAACILHLKNLTLGNLLPGFFPQWAQSFEDLITWKKKISFLCCNAEEKVKKSMQQERVWNTWQDILLVSQYFALIRVLLIQWSCSILWVTSDLWSFVSLCWWKRLCLIFFFCQSKLICWDYAQTVKSETKPRQQLRSLHSPSVPSFRPGSPLCQHFQKGTESKKWWLEITSCPYDCMVEIVKAPDNRRMSTE